jgi:RHS repeat-associated protein
LFQGMRHESLSGLTAADHRWYSVVLGRWSTVDPMLFDGGDVVLYRAMGNNTTNATDPSGLFSPIFPINPPISRLNRKMDPMPDPETRWRVYRDGYREGQSEKEMLEKITGRELFSPPGQPFAGQQNEYQRAYSEGYNDAWSGMLSKPRPSEESRVQILIIFPFFASPSIPRSLAPPNSPISGPRGILAPTTPNSPSSGPRGVQIPAAPNVPSLPRGPGTAVNPPPSLGTPAAPGVGQMAVQPPGFCTVGRVPLEGWHPALRIDGQVYVGHMHVQAQELSATRFVQGRDLYGRVRLDATGSVVEVQWGQ